MRPPQASPTAKASASDTPKSSRRGRPSPSASSASATTAPSTQPPETEPTMLASPPTASCAPTGRGAEPQVSITVASAAPRPARTQASAASGLLSCSAGIVRSAPSGEPNGIIQAESVRSRGPSTFGENTNSRPKAARRGRRFPEAGQCRGEALQRGEVVAGLKVSTCGRMARMPRAFGVKPSQRSSGFSQISRRADRCRRCISRDRRSGSSPRSRPSVISSTTAPWASTRRDQSRLKACRQAPMRVPPSQSAPRARRRPARRRRRAGADAG